MVGCGVGGGALSAVGCERKALPLLPGCGMSPRLDRRIPEAEEEEQAITKAQEPRKRVPAGWGNCGPELIRKG